MRSVSVYFALGLASAWVIRWSIDASSSLIFVDPSKHLLRHLREFLLHLSEDMVHEVRQVLRLRRDAVKIVNVWRRLPSIFKRTMAQTLRQCSRGCPARESLSGLMKLHFSKMTHLQV
jgi:hypothetical protein